MQSQSQAIITPEYPGLVDMTDELNCLLFNAKCNSSEDEPVKVILTAGTWVINGTVTLKYRDHIVLEHGASILRQQAKKKQGLTEPIFLLMGDYATIEGSNRNEIRCEQSNMPNGIIKIGHQSSRAKGGIDHCHVTNLVIAGPEQASKTYSKVTGIYLYNNQHESAAPANNHNYFHTISDIVFQRVDIGIQTYNTNACTFTNLVFNRVGRNGGYAFLLEGSQENKISNVHHHNSIHANSIGFKDSSRANPTEYNSIINYVIEIGKEGSGYCIDLDVPIKKFYHNTLSMSCNHTKVVNYRHLSKSMEHKKQRSTYFNKVKRNTMLDHSMYVLFKD